MNSLAQHKALADLHAKVEVGERLTEADALRLFESRDLNALGAMASVARERKVGDTATFIVNRYINYSNYCILSCQFCSFARKKRDGDGFELTLDPAHFITMGSLLYFVMVRKELFSTIDKMFSSEITAIFLSSEENVIV